MQTRKHEAIPPFLQQKPIDPTAKLVYIKTEISAIYTAAKDSYTNDDQALNIDHDKYIELYTAVHDFCTTIVQRSKAQPGDANAEFRNLYQYLVDEIKGYCIDVRGNIFSVDDNAMDENAARKVLTIYSSHHRKFIKLSSLLRNLLGFWDRYWIRREWLEKKIQVASVEELHKVIWKAEVLEKGMEGVADAVAILSETKGDMTEYDAVLVKDVVKGLSGLGVTLDS